MDYLVGSTVPKRARRHRRALSLVMGTALGALALRRRSPTGIGLAVLDGILAFSDPLRKNGRDLAAEPAFSEAITINRRPNEIYDFWTDPTNLSRVLRHIARVEERGDGTTRWTMRAKVPRIAWDAKIVDRIPSKRVAWQSLPGGDIDARCELRLSHALPGRGTKVKLTLHHGAAGASLLMALLRAFGNLLLREDLRRLKALLECGTQAALVEEGASPHFSAPRVVSWARRPSARR